ncbi:MerR family transcriptional regulator [Arthrobacter sp. TWP1-1]|uniref:MerR family transcriptional regulator n=1 Tax=Arthrobacter sp. TWP1-1 TaxID=2804568 RepID=UPI003CFADBBC
MAISMSIGDFSRATLLSAKTLRFYHQVGLLDPARVDPSNGYRFYDTDQINQAQVIRHFRALDMSVETIRELLAVPSIADRNELIGMHLKRMEAQLEETRSAVASLRNLLQPSADQLEVRHISVPPTPAVVVRDIIKFADLGVWYGNAMNTLTAVIETTDLQPAGPRGGIWETELFLHEKGEVALFFPLSMFDGGLPHPGLPYPGPAQIEMLPAVDLAVVRHQGRDETVAEVYAALGSYVARHEIGVDGPLRESYITERTPETPEAITEIGRPIFRTAR